MTEMSQESTSPKNRNSRLVADHFDARKSSFSTDDREVLETGRGNKRWKRGGWATSPFIFGCEAAERLATTGSHANLITFLVQQMHQKNLNAAANLNIFMGVSMLTPLLGAFAADAYLGRYKTIVLGLSVYLSGLIILTVTALDGDLRPLSCPKAEANANVGLCQKSSSLQIGIVYLSFVLMALGSGGIRPCVSPFGASQFDQNVVQEKNQLKHYFNWFFFSVTVAEVLATTTIVYVQDAVGWGLGFGIPAIVMLFSITTFLVGTCLYRQSEPSGSSYVRMTQVIVAAFRKRHLTGPDDPSKLYSGCSSKAGKQIKPDTDGDITMGKGTLAIPHQLQQEDLLQHCDQFRFLDKAAIQVEEDSYCKYSVEHEETNSVPTFSPWRLCPVHQVEELKCIIRMIPLWITAVPTAVVMSQQHTFTVQQARSMDRNLGSFVVPAASLRTISTITILLWLPLFDRLLTPFLKRCTGQANTLNFLHKIGIGLILHLLAMMTSTFVEHKRRSTAAKFGLLSRPAETIPISALWLVPQFVIGGLAESFTIIGHLEFFYFLLPDHMTSTGSALLMTAIALGAISSSMLLHLVQAITRGCKWWHGVGWLPDNLNRAHLDFFYALLTILLFFDFLIYIRVTRWYQAQQNVLQILVSSA